MSLIHQRVVEAITRLSNLPSRARPADHVEVVAWIWWVLWVDSIHKLLENQEGTQATNTAVIKREQAELVGRHCKDTAYQKAVMDMSDVIGLV